MTPMQGLADWLRAMAGPHSFAEPHERECLRAWADEVEKARALLAAPQAAQEPADEASDSGEPVAWGDVKTRPDGKRYCRAVATTDQANLGYAPLYTRPAVTLTDEEIKEMVFEHTKLNPNQRDDLELLDYIVSAIRAILARAGIGGEHE